ncbi:type IX secretion system protein PorD [Ichthyenterobacterium magnum]|uniref:Uncharacterized protein DUF4835 n=1 Tax=Ichthyenterobacterium magnum TaxID=1230530 RepID=A0A420DLK4_9FLAO|nr:DUF4835 family protein [Ichthyenterobacterium magnum]RKE95081.1 uncharacterized protein DUF4835 [Ichthyenterobacterium magnum]
MRNSIIFIALLFLTNAFAQELNCNVVVNAQQTGNENVQVFKTLERQLQEFVSNTKWTDNTYKPQERIDCNIIINVSDYSGDNFKAELQVQSSRPVYNSSYETPIYNFSDENFSFKYLEFQNLVFNSAQFESNLVSVLAFHIYMIFGLDADTFSLKGGDKYLKQAQTILNYSQQGNYKGWKLEDGNRTRFTLIDNILSPTFKEYRSAMYNYHRNGLDVMNSDAKEGKQQIASTILSLVDMNRRRPNSLMMRVFFDAKAEEIESVFSDGPSVNISEVIDVLNKVAPTHASKWRTINY